MQREARGRFSVKLLKIPRALWIVFLIELKARQRTRKRKNAAVSLAQRQGPSSAPNRRLTYPLTDCPWKLQLSVTQNVVTRDLWQVNRQKATGATAAAVFIGHSLVERVNMTASTLTFPRKLNTFNEPVAWGPAFLTKRFFPC